MPVEIKELVIRTVIGKGGAEPHGEAPEAPREDAGASEEIVQECVRQVLRILAKDRER
jgi:Family of unknown function (DUF5908)